MPSKPVQVNPAVLAQARAVGGLAPEDAADRLKLAPARLQALERGAELPTLPMLRRMATVYAVPLGTLLMPEPIEAPSLPEDMRTVGGRARPLSAATRRIIREVQDRQALAREIAEEAPEILPKPTLPRLALDADPSESGETERQRLAPEWREQLQWRDAAEAFRTWRALVESTGVLVFSEAMDRDEARGFSLPDHTHVPVAVVNSRESSQAKSFTLFHEYAHLLLRESALCLELEAGGRGGVERFCNRFAAAFLMPVAAVNEVISALEVRRVSEGPLDLDWLAMAAGRLKVSRQALLLRLEELGLAPPGSYDRLSDKLAADSWSPRSRRGGGPSYAAMLLSRLGTGYTSLVLDALSAHVIDTVAASEMLNAPARTFPDIARQLGKRG